MSDKFQKKITGLISIIELGEYSKLPGSLIEARIIQHSLEQNSKF